MVVVERRRTAPDIISKSHLTSGAANRIMESGQHGYNEKKNHFVFTLKCELNMTFDGRPFSTIATSINLFLSHSLSASS